MITGASSDFGCGFIEKYHKNYDTVIAHIIRTRISLKSSVNDVRESLFPCRLILKIQTVSGG